MRVDLEVEHRISDALREREMSLEEETLEKFDRGDAAGIDQVRELLSHTHPSS